MHVVAIIGGIWVMIIGAFIFIPIGNFLGVKAENLALISAYIFCYIIFFLNQIGYLVLNSKKIEGRIIEYSKKDENKKMLYDVYIEKNNNKIIKIKKLLFEESAWNYLPLMQEMRVFFIDYVKILNSPTVWAFTLHNGKYHISKEMHMDRSNIKIFILTIFNLALIYIAFVVTHFGPDNKFHLDMFLWFSLFPATFLVLQYINIPCQKRFFENRMKLLDENGLPRPLTWS